MTDELQEAVPSQADDLFFTGVPYQVSKVKALLYGPSGSGKTRLASTFPKPVFLDFDGSVTGLKTDIGRFPRDPGRRLDSWDDFRKVIGVLKSGKHPFETIVIDSMNEMLAVLSDHIVKKYPTGPMRRNFGDVPALADFSKINLDFLRATRAVLALPYHVVFTCTIKDRSQNTDLVEPKLSGQLTKDVIKFFDLVGYLVVQEGDGKRRSYNVSFAYGPDYVTKDRFDVFPPIVPSNWSEIKRYIYGEGENA